MKVGSDGIVHISHSMSNPLNACVNFIFTHVLTKAATSLIPCVIEHA